MARKRVLITGAAGYLSRQLLPVFRERYDLVLLDRRKPHDTDDIIEVDLINPDIDTYREHFKGVDAIVHNTRSTRPGANTGAPRQWLEDRPLGDLEGYYVERDSLDMAYHVSRHSRRNGELEPRHRLVRNQTARRPHGLLRSHHLPAFGQLLRLGEDRL